MPSPVNAPDASLPAPIPARLDWLRRVVGSPAALLIATTAVNGGLLTYYFLHLIRGDLYYKFSEFVFDYRYGVIRRGLAGEVFRHLLPPPYSLAQFQCVANLLLLAAILLFLLIGLVALRRHPHPGVACLLLVIAASPLTFKNQIFDQGRQDIFGLIFLEVVMLALLAERPRTALAVATAGILPLSLIHEGQLLIFVPAVLVALALARPYHAFGAKVVVPCSRWREQEAPGVPARGSTRLMPTCEKSGLGPASGLSWRAYALPLAVFAGSLLINWALPPPRAPYTVFHHYLKSKLQDPFPFDADWFLYQRLAGARAYAVSELHRQARFQFASAWDYLAALAVLAAVAFGLPTRNGRGGRPRRRFLLAATWLVPGYAVLFWLASDWARWVADFSFCFLLLAFLLVVRDRVRPALAPLLVIAALQLAGTGPFGVEVPELCLGYRVASLVGIPASPAETDYARHVAYQRGVRCLRINGDVPRAVHYLQRAVAIKPRAADRTYLGVALILDRQSKEGIAELRAAVHADPTLVMAHYYLAAVLLKQPGQSSAALAQLRAAQRLDPRFPPVLNLLKQIESHPPAGTRPKP